MDKQIQLRGLQGAILSAEFGLDLGCSAPPAAMVEPVRLCLQHLRSMGFLSSAQPVVAPRDVSGQMQASHGRPSRHHSATAFNRRRKPGPRLTHPDALLRQLGSEPRSVFPRVEPCAAAAFSHLTPSGERHRVTRFVGAHLFGDLQALPLQLVCRERL